jgi:hypothetical protein
MISVALSVIAAILFYRLVERRHKIILARVAIGVAVLVGLGAAYLAWSSHRAAAEDEKRRKAVSVVFIPATSPKPDDGLPRFVPDTVTFLTFRVCNEAHDTLASVTFLPKARYRGRSGEHDLTVAVTGVYVDPAFSSDFEVAPHSCSSVSFKGRFVVLDTVVMDYVLPTFANRGQ